MTEGAADSNHNHVTPPGTVIVLGAGASASDGAPVQSELFHEYFESATMRGRVSLEMREDLKKYFMKLWGIDVSTDSLDGTKFPTFEEALGLLEIAHARGEFFKGLSWSDQPLGRARELRSHLTALIALIIEEKLRGECPNHAKLVSQLKESDSLASTTFVSLNYDIIIDNVIERVTNEIPDYRVSFSPEPHRNGASWEPCVTLLKLHGSLNWLFCTVCNTLSLFSGRKAAAELPGAPWGFRCSACHEIQIPIIIPPTFFKVMSNFYLQQIWKRAEEELKRADRIIFCGYSFPDADIHVKYLLKRAEVNRNGPPPSIFIVNEHRKKKKQQREQEKDRYERFFREKGRVHWTKLSFQQFAADPNLIEDQSKWL